MNAPTTSNPNNTPIIPKNDWVKQLSQAYRNIGVSENGIRNLIAKNALESNWGKSAQGRYNYGNITTGSSWKGDFVNGHDTDGHGHAIRNKFRSYNSLEEFAQDEVSFLKRLYDFDDNDDIDTFTYKLQGGNKGKRHYAGDPRYRSSVKSVYKGLG
jgi:flagellum-specific peptidoglycan hydrolase FlgJ